MSPILTPALTAALIASAAIVAAPASATPVDVPAATEIPVVPNGVDAAVSAPAPQSSATAIATATAITTGTGAVIKLRWQRRANVSRYHVHTRYRSGRSAIQVVSQTRWSGWSGPRKLSGSSTAATISRVAHDAQYQVKLEAKSGRKWQTIRRASVETPAAPEPTTAPKPGFDSELPGGNLPGWKAIYAEHFLTDAPLGTFLTRYAGKLGAYPTPWTDTSRNKRANPGYYNSAKTLSASGGAMDAWLHYDARLGKYLVAAPTPKLPTMKFGRFAMRMRADQIPGYKVAPLLWPDSESWPAGGEIDFPEGCLKGKPLKAFAHYANPNGGQDAFSTGVDHTDWHVYETAWSPTKVEFFVDGALVGTSTTDVPQGPMHWVLQFETEESAIAPPTTSEGHVQVDWLKAYSYAPGTA